MTNKADRLQLARSLDDAVEVIILIVPTVNQLNRGRDNTRDPCLDAVILLSDPVLTYVLVAWKKQAFVSFYNAMNAAPEAYHGRTRGGGLPYESDGGARRKIRINTLKETNLGVAPAFFNP